MANEQKLRELLQRAMYHSPFENNETCPPLSGKTRTFCMECDAESYSGWDAITHKESCAYPQIQAALAESGAGQTKTKQGECTFSMPDDGAPCGKPLPCSIHPLAASLGQQAEEEWSGYGARATQNKERAASGEQTREVPFDIYGHGFPQILIDAWEHREKQWREQTQPLAKPEPFDALAWWKQEFPGWLEPTPVEKLIAERCYAAGRAASGGQLSAEAIEAHRMLDIEGIECGPNHAEPRSLAYRIGLVFEKLEAAPATPALSEEQVRELKAVVLRFALLGTSDGPGILAGDGVLEGISIRAGDIRDARELLGLPRGMTWDELKAKRAELGWDAFKSNALLRSEPLTGAIDCCLACGGTGRSQSAGTKGDEHGRT